MPSLKDLRNRIASVKATQKITKAMQMVAAAKLRRAQSVAEAARPYASRMEAVLANLATALRGREGAPPLMIGTGKDQVHLLVVCTGERGLSGAFNSAIVRLAREHLIRLIADGKEVKILCVGKKGFDQLKRNYSHLIIDTIEFRGVRQISFEHAERVAEKVLALFAEGAFDVATLFYSRFRSVISQVPTAQQMIPATISAEATAQEAALGVAVYDYEPDEAKILTRCCRRISGCSSLGSSRKRGRLLRRPDDRDGQCDAQCRRPHQCTHHSNEPYPSGADHQGADRDHLRCGRRLIARERNQP